jgi:ABC-2 type transport system permease protein
MLVGSFMPWIDPEKLGPTFVGHYLFAYVVFGLPTLLALGAGFFALATATRSMMWTFIGVVVFLILFVVSRVMLRDPAWDTVSAWTDPFGMSALNQATKYWTPAERNTRLPPLEGLLLYNRLLWLAVGMALFALAYGVFRFEVSGSSVMAGKASAGQGGVAEAVPAPHPLARPRSGGGAFAVQFLALVRFDMRFVLRSPAFIVLLFLGLFNAVGALSGIVSDRGVDYLPVTRAVINAMEGGFNLFPTLIAIFYGGELVWRDRERRMHEIVDASAAPDWAFMLPKALAVSGVLLATYGAAVLGAMAFQAFHGYMRFELGLYLLGFLLPGFFTAALLGVLSVFVQALVPHKFVGWAVMLVWLVASFVLGSLGFELNVYNYGAVPAVPLSDMNGLGHFWLGRAWTQAYWAAFAAVLLVLAHLLWRRGGDTRLRPRLARLPLRLRGGAGVLLGTAALAWVGLGGWVLYNLSLIHI